MFKKPKKDAALPNRAQDAVERPWAFAIDQAVATDHGGGKVIWRREDAAGKREYQVALKDGTSVWVGEEGVEARA